MNYGLRIRKKSPKEDKVELLVPAGVTGVQLYNWINLNREHFEEVKNKVLKTGKELSVTMSFHNVPYVEMDTGMDTKKTKMDTIS